MNVLSFILMLMVLQRAQVKNDAEKYLRRGLDLEQQGQFVQALDLWQEAISELAVPSVAIATEYLRLATEHELHDYYRAASFNYLWGMSGGDETTVKENRKPLAEELTRLEPLVDRREYKQWQSLLEVNDPALFKEILSFWKRIDLTPASAYNECL